MCKVSKITQDNIKNEKNLIRILMFKYYSNFEIKFEIFNTINEFINDE